MYSGLWRKNSGLSEATFTGPNFTSVYSFDDFIF